MLAKKNAGNNKANPNCVGENVSPPLAWANLPAGTKSYALLMIDPEGRGGLGVIHWVAYGIPAVGDRLRRGRDQQAVPKVRRRQGHRGPGASTWVRARRRDRRTTIPSSLIATDLDPEGAAAGPDQDGAAATSSTVTPRARPAWSGCSRSRLS